MEQDRHCRQFRVIYRPHSYIFHSGSLPESTTLNLFLFYPNPSRHRQRTRKSAEIWVEWKGCDNILLLGQWTRPGVTHLYRNTNGGKRGFLTFFPFPYHHSFYSSWSDTNSVHSFIHFVVHFHFLRLFSEERKGSSLV